MLPTSITAVAEIDDVLRCDPEPLLRFLHGSRHVWVPSPGRVVLWRDDLDGDDGAASLSPLVIGYWAAVLQRSPHLPYLVVPGGRCVLELFVAACGPRNARMVDGIAVVDRLEAQVTLEEWIEVIQRTGAEHDVDPDALGHHVDAITAFLRNAVVQE